MTLLTNFVLANYIEYLGRKPLQKGLKVPSGLGWDSLFRYSPAGFVGRKSFKVFVINALHYLVALLTSGIILALWQ